MEWGLGNQTSGCYDAPRLGVTTDKVIVTANFYTSCGSTVHSHVWVINESDMDNLDTTISNDEVTYTGYNLQPTTTPSYEASILFEMPDFNTANDGTMLTHYVTGTQGSETWTSNSWTIGNVCECQFDAQQKGTSDELDGDSNEAESAAFTGGTAWVDANDSDATGLLTPTYVAFNVNGSAKPTSIDNYFDVANPNGWNMYYPALGSTISSTSIIGTVDYSCNSSTCGSNPQYAGSQEYEMSDSGSIVYAGRQSGDSSITFGGNPTRWGDINGCDYVNGTSPAEVTCVAQFASGGSSASEVFTDEYS
jgi:hypothetical protein